MATQIFDRDTLLDLVVNFIPLFIILFFTVGFVVFNPFGFEGLASGIQFGLLVAPFLFLAILTYISGKAIAGAEKDYTVYLPGQATVTGARPLHELEEEEAAAEAESETPELEDASADDAEAESEDENAELEAGDDEAESEDDTEADNTEADDAKDN